MIALKHLALLGAYAWHSKHPNHDAGLYICKQWSMQMPASRAIAEAKTWLKRLLLDLCIDHRARDGHWAQSRRIHGIDFVPLLTAQDLFVEAGIMRNCIMQYGEALLFGRCRLYSLQQDGARLANLEVKATGRGRSRSRIGQFKGPRNKHPTIETQIAAEAWLATQQIDSCSTLERTPPLRSVAWEYLWRPYIDAKGTRGILEPDPRPEDVMTVYLAYMSVSRRLADPSRRLR